MSWRVRAAWPVIVLGGPALLLALAGDAARLALRYDRDAVLGGEVWRFATGHLVHLGWAHTVLNVVGLGLVWALVGSALGGLGWLAVIAGSLAAMGAGFVCLEPGLAWYVGLSGLLHGLFAGGAMALAARGRVPGDRQGRREGRIMLVLIAAKLAWEQLAGPLPMTAATAGGPVIVDAHLYGALGGLATAALVLCLGPLRR